MEKLLEEVKKIDIQNELNFELREVAGEKYIYGVVNNSSIDMMEDYDERIWRWVELLCKHTYTDFECDSSCCGPIDDLSIDYIICRKDNGIVSL